MPELGYMLYLLALAYAFGHLWYGVIGHHYDDWMRICSYPFLGIVMGEAIYVNFMAMPAGPEFYGIHVVIASGATLIATLVDLLVHNLRPAHEQSLRPAHA